MGLKKSCLNVFEKTRVQQPHIQTHFLCTVYYLYISPAILSQLNAIN